MQTIERVGGFIVQETHDEKGFALVVRFPGLDANLHVSGKYGGFGLVETLGGNVTIEEYVLVELLRQLKERAEEAPRWIAVEDESPACELCDGGWLSVPVIGWDGKRVIPCYFSRDDDAEERFMTDEGLPLLITHWTPVPAPPENA